MIWDWHFVVKILPDLLQGLKVTVYATAGGSGVALILGLVIAIARLSRIGPVRWVATSWMKVIRGTPLLVQLYFLYYVLPKWGVIMAPLLTGIIGLGINYSSYVSEAYRAGIEAVPRTQWEASRAVNLPWVRTWTRIILPQAIPPIVPVLGNYVNAMFKASALLAAISVPELFDRATVVGNSTYRYFEPLTLVGLLYLGISVPVTFMLRGLEVRIARRGPRISRMSRITQRMT